MSERRLLLASGAYIDLSEYLLKSEAETLYAPLDAILNKQDKLISGTNIKTINNENILGSGNITISLTESDIAAMGFTKNTGTYSKPSTGIPKSDLANAVQTSLGKADTALQSYTEQYKGTVTGVKINGTTKSQSNGIVDLGTVITEHQTLKTINGESIIGSGDIDISVGGSAKEIINLMGPNITIDQMLPNKVYAVHLTGGSFTISSFVDSGYGTETPYDFAYEEYLAIIKTPVDSSISLTLPDNLLWANGEVPSFEVNTFYELSITKHLHIGFSYFKAVLIPFKQIE